jgi:hypothetical protein
VSYPPIDIRDSFKKHVLEFWKRQHHFPRHMVDPQYDNHIPKGYENIPLIPAPSSNAVLKTNSQNSSYNTLDKLL